MKIIYTPSFKRQYKKLTVQIKQLAEEKEQYFRTNPFDSRLKTHKLHGVLGKYWAFSVDFSTRIVLRFVSSDEVAFHFIGDHSIYE